MPLVEDDHMIQAFSTDGPDNTFDIRILPWRAARGDNLIYAQAPDPSLNLLAVYRIAITQKIAWRGIEWHGDLLPERQVLKDQLTLRFE